jgi:hypothetical protein
VPVATRIAGLQAFNDERKLVGTFRAYVLLDIQRNKSQEVAKALRDKPGVVAVDIVEGPPDVVAVLEAS